jgi:hypothetical protein
MQSYHHSYRLGRRQLHSQWLHGSYMMDGKAPWITASISRKVDGWILWWSQHVEPPVDSRALQFGGRFGTASFTLERSVYTWCDRLGSFRGRTILPLIAWTDLSLYPFLRDTVSQ